jgi:hypothetical protein
MARSTVPPLNRQVAIVQRRLFFQDLLNRLIVGWLAALVLTAAWFLLQPLLFADPWTYLRWTVLGGLLGLSTVVAALLAWFRAPDRLTSALFLDERFKLKERVTTGLMLTPEETNSPAGMALLEDVNQRVVRLPVGTKFPVRLPKMAALLPLGAGLLLLLAVFYNPRIGQAQDDDKKPLSTDPVVAQEIKDQLKQLQKKAKPLLDRPRSPELDRLDEERDKLSRAKTETREEAKEVVKQMGTLEEQLQQRDKELARRADALREQMRQADRLANKTQKEGPAQKMNKALDQGDFKKAQKEAEMLAKQLQAEEQAERLRKKLQDPNLTKEEKEKIQKELEKVEGQKLSQKQKEQMQEQLKDLQEKIDRLSRDAKKREQELRDMEAKGQISKEQLERELDQLKDNLGKIDPQTLKELKDLAEKLGECQQCLCEGKDCDASKKLGECAGKLAKLDLNGEQKELARQLAMLQEARQCICQALDGNPRPASGRRPDGKEHETKSQEARSRSELDKGQLQIVDHVPGQGLKTLRNQAELTEEIRQAAQAAPEAIDRQRLPRSASDMARGYFEKLRGPEKKSEK